MRKGNSKISEYGKKTQFKPGQSGNPAGMPKGYESPKDILRRLLAIDVVGQDIDGNMIKMSVGEEIYTAVVRKARGGDGFSVDRITKIVDDKEAQKVTITFDSEANSLGSGVFSEIVRSIHGDKSE